MTMQRVDLYDQPIVSAKVGVPPLFINVVTTPSNAEYTQGVPATATKAVTYVLYDVLPDDLRAKIKLAIDVLRTAG